MAGSAATVAQRRVARAMGLARKAIPQGHAGTWGWLW